MCAFREILANHAISHAWAVHGEEVQVGPQVLAKLGREDIMIVVGGVIPPQDYDALYEAGASAIFGPGTVITAAAETLLTELNKRLGYQPA